MGGRLGDERGRHFICCGAAWARVQRKSGKQETSSLKEDAGGTSYEFRRLQIHPARFPVTFCQALSIPLSSLPLCNKAVHFPAVLLQLSEVTRSKRCYFHLLDLVSSLDLVTWKFRPQQIVGECFVLPFCCSWKKLGMRIGCWALQKAFSMGVPKSGHDGVKTAIIRIQDGTLLLPWPAQHQWVRKLHHQRHSKVLHPLLLHLVRQISTIIHPVSLIILESCVLP